MRRPQKKHIFLNVFLFAILLQVVLWIWQLLPYNFVLEENFQKFVQIANSSSNSNTIAESDILFVDVSAGFNFTTAGGRRQIITDRGKLDTLFRMLNQYVNPRLIICDLYFDLPSAKDQALAQTLSQTPHIFCAENTGNDGRQIPNLFFGKGSAPTAYQTYPHPWLIFGNTLIKFRPILEDGRKTLPVRLYEDYTNHAISNSYFGIYADHGLNLNSLTVQPNVMLDPDTVVKADQIKPIDTLIRDLKFNRLESRSNLSRKKIILIGDFHNDIHGTAYGTTPGPIIVLNLFISLLNGANRLNIVNIVITLFILLFLILEKVYGLYYLLPFNWYRRFNTWLDQKFQYFGFQGRPKFVFFIWFIFCIIFCIEIIPALLLLELLYKARLFYRRCLNRYRRHKIGNIALSRRLLIPFLFKKNYRIKP
jgi:CHASE2 domain